MVPITPLRLIQSKYSASPHITNTYMKFSHPQANASGGYTMIRLNFNYPHIPKIQKEEIQAPISTYPDNI